MIRSTATIRATSAKEAGMSSRTLWQAGMCG
jgi:hypothetical protein